MDLGWIQFCLDGGDVIEIDGIWEWWILKLLTTTMLTLWIANGDGKIVTRDGMNVQVLWFEPIRKANVSYMLRSWNKPKVGGNHVINSFHFGGTSSHSKHRRSWDFCQRWLLIAGFFRGWYSFKIHPFRWEWIDYKKKMKTMSWSNWLLPTRSLQKKG